MRKRVILLALCIGAGISACGSRDKVVGDAAENPRTIRTCGGVLVPHAAIGGVVLSGDERIYDTNDGHFRIHYTMSGEDAVDSVDTFPKDNIPDFITILEEGFTDAWEGEVVRLGWRPPPSDGGFGGDARYDVFVKKCGIITGGRECNGATFILSLSPDGGRSSFITIDPRNPLMLGRVVGNGPLFVKATCVHEFNHACQLAYGSFEGWWMENSATWIEFEIYDLLKDLTPAVDILLNDRFAENSLPLTYTDGQYEYANAIWPKYMADSRGRDIDTIRRIWERARQGPSISYPGILGAIHDVLLQNGGGLITDFQRFTEWNYISCAYDDDVHYFRGAFPTTSYGSVKMDSVVTVYPTSVAQAPVSVSPLGASYLRFVPDPSSQDLGISFTGESGIHWGLSLVLHRPSCEYVTAEYIVPDTGVTGTTIADMNAYDRIILIVQNLETTASPGRTFSYTAVTSGTRTPGPPPPSPVLTKIGIVPTAITLFVGNVEELGAIGSYSDCTRANLTRTAYWTSGNARIASITGNGVLTALSPGRTNLTAEKAGVRSPIVPVTVLSRLQEPFLRSRGWGCQAARIPGDAGEDTGFPISFPPGVPRGWGAGILCLVGVIFIFGAKWRKPSRSAVIPQSRRVDMYQEVFWRIILLFSLLDFTVIQISQETRYFPWPNCTGILLMSASLVLYRRTIVPPWKALAGTIRFPHHLAAVMWAAGFPLALSCGIGVLMIALVLVPTYIYRMDVEDDALRESLGQPYLEYMERTERMIPWIY